MPDVGNQDADGSGREAEESQSHLPGDIEDGFEFCIHCIPNNIELSLYSLQRSGSFWGNPDLSPHTFTLADGYVLEETGRMILSLLEVFSEET